MPSELSNPSHRPAYLPAKRSPGKPPHEPTDADRQMVETMVAGGIFQADIARARGISLPTLRKHYREELDNGKTKIDTMVVEEHIKAIKRGDFQAIKWWEQSRMNYRGDGGEDRPADQSMRVVVEFVGEAAPAGPTIEHAPRRDDDGRDALRRNVQLVG